MTNVFDADAAFGLMCQVEVGDGPDTAIFVAPIAELAFGLHPIARDIANYRRSRALARVADSA
ncbi:hypothetical protein [Methylosinus sporium]|uniref:hypothetical protein n=1 Tax=Methylosinus sporium TaxID=428 RepID=UPI00383AD3C4